MFWTTNKLHVAPQSKKQAYHKRQNQSVNPHFCVNSLPKFIEGARTEISVV